MTATANGHRYLAHARNAQGQPTPVLLPGESPLTEEPDGLQSMGPHRVVQD